jgi:hypothetical protein
MKLFRILFLLSAFLNTDWLALAQEPEDTTQRKDPAIEQLKYKQQPGLALAASKIYFSDKRYSISGFGEFSYIPYQTGLSLDLGDLELYYTGLYRYATFFGYRFTDKIIWNSELQIELLHAGTDEVDYEVVVEAFADFLITDYFKARVGFFPLTIGYVNNNDEPVMFYSVNRSDVERIITPSTWIEFGSMFYGNITDNWSYALGLTQGLNSANFLSGTWIRQGREIRFDIPNSLSANPQLNYTGIKNLTLSASAYFGNSGRGEEVLINGQNEAIRATIQLGTAYAKYDWKNWRFVSVGTYGRLSDTDKIFAQTLATQGTAQVLGSEVYGYLVEAGCDILPYFRKDNEIQPKKNFLYDREALRLIVFGRFERLNTHYGLMNNLAMAPRVENNLAIYTGGINFNTRENIVFKTNYRYAFNYYQGDPNPSKHIVELGVGFIF